MEREYLVQEGTIIIIPLTPEVSQQALLTTELCDDAFEALDHLTTL